MQHAFSSRWIRYFVPNIGTLILMALMLLVYRASAAPGSPPTAPDATPGTISYQGMLNDAAGQPINSNTGITFRLYNTPTGATTAALWTEAHTGANAVPISNGLFNVLLGSLTPIPASVWSNANVYLGVLVGSDAEMAPREVIGAVPSAQMTQSIANFESGTKCLSVNTALSMPGNWSSVTVPGLALNFSLSSPSKILVWLDGMFIGGGNNNLNFFLTVDNEGQAGFWQTSPSSWMKLTGQRIVNLDSGSHSLGLVFSTEWATSITVYGESPSATTCVNYLVLGGQ